jgi:hypothetical protein
MSEPITLETLQAEKLRRETEKLELEMKILRRPAWAQAPYIAAILPVTAIVITGFITAWITYSNRNSRSKLMRRDLKWSTRAWRTAYTKCNLWHSY